jgi:hypothetical protein
VLKLTVIHEVYKRKTLRLAERLLLEYLNGDTYSIKLCCLSMGFKNLNSAAVTVARSSGVSPNGISPNVFVTNVKSLHIVSPMVSLLTLTLLFH